MGMRVRMLVRTGTATGNSNYQQLPCWAGLGWAGVLEILKLTNHDDESQHDSGKGVESDVVPNIEELAGSRCLLIE